MKFKIIIGIAAILGLIIAATILMQEQAPSMKDFIKAKKALIKEEKEVSLIAVGDVMLSRAVARKMAQNSADYPFLQVKDYLKTGDIVFGNLEAPIAEGRKIQDFEMSLRANPGVEKNLREAGFSVLSLANNHTMNFGEKALKETLENLDKENIKYVGAGENTKTAYGPGFIEKNGLHFAFLAYSDDRVCPADYEATDTRAGIAFMDTQKMISEVKKAKESADIVIVSMHSGQEYQKNQDKIQTDFAHAAIDNGADLIIGHHPHVIQPLEKYKDKYIFYSLGNFIFDQILSQEVKEGLTFKAYFNKKGITKIELIPVFIRDLSQPQILEGKDADKILERLKFPINSEEIFKKEKFDLNKNALEENYTLNNGELTISENSKILWESGSDWWIDKFVLADSNNDGVTEINMSVWKSGNFGPSKPFWVKKNDPSIKNHFFVFNLDQNGFKPLWQSSNLEAPNCDFAIKDVDSDNKNDLIVFEGNYSDKNENCNREYTAVWEWNGWGFSNKSRSPK